MKRYMSLPMLSLIHIFSGGQKTFLVGERPKVEIIRPSIPRNLTKVGPETVSKPSAARNLSVNVQAGQVIEHEIPG